MELRFGQVRPGRGLYESVYLTAVHPDQPQALWVRTTVQKRPDARPTGALWVTWFGPDGVRAGKLSDLPVAGTDTLICGVAEQGPSGSRGSMDLASLSARWDLSFTARADPLEHLSPHLLYAAPLPKTKATSPLPDLGVSGGLSIDGTPIDLTGWTGMLGHNWGTEHAARWAWLRVCGLGDDQTGWLDAVLGRVRIGPILSPWTAFGALSLDGRRHSLGGFGRRCGVEVRSDGAVITLTGSGVSARVVAAVDRAAVVGWEYADPRGHRHEVVNSSVATMELAVTGGGRARTFAPRRRGVLEIGGDQRAFDVPLQPFAD